MCTFLLLQAYSCSIDGTVRLWDFTDGILIKVQLSSSLLTGAGPSSLCVQPAALRHIVGKGFCTERLFVLRSARTFWFSFRPTSSDNPFPACMRQSTTWESFSSSFLLRETKNQVGSSSTSHHFWFMILMS